MDLSQIINIAQIIVSLVLVILILLQERGSDASGLFGAGGGSDVGFYQRRRGFERVLFFSTVILIMLFAGLAIANLFI